VTDNTITWDNHIDQLISRFNSACYAIRAVTAMLSRKALRMLYVSYVHSIISYDIMFLFLTDTLCHHIMTISTLLGCNHKEMNEK
jgi:hypothetical protein